MGRRWTTKQYMDRYERRLERRAFNKMWDEVHHPPSPDGTRRCANCARNASCTRNRRCNHGACFVAAARSAPANEAEQKSNVDLFFVAKIVLVVAVWIAIACWNWTIAMIVLILAMLFIRK